MTFSDKPIIEVEITLGGVNEDNFGSFELGLTQAVANTVGVNEALVSLTLSRKAERLKRDDDIDYVIKASIEVANGINQDQLTANIGDSASFINKLNNEIQNNHDLQDITAKTVGEPIVTEEGNGRSFHIFSTRKSKLIFSRALDKYVYNCDFYFI